MDYAGPLENAKQIILEEMTKELSEDPAFVVWNYR